MNGNERPSGEATTPATQPPSSDGADFVPVRWECRIACGALLTEDQIATHRCGEGAGMNEDESLVRGAFDVRETPVQPHHCGTCKCPPTDRGFVFYSDEREALNAALSRLIVAKENATPTQLGAPLLEEAAVCLDDAAEATMEAAREQYGDHPANAHRLAREQRFADQCRSVAKRLRTPPPSSSERRDDDKSVDFHNGWNHGYLAAQTDARAEGERRDEVTDVDAARAFEFCGRLLGPNWYARLRQIVEESVNRTATTGRGVPNGGADGS